MRLLYTLGILVLLSSCAQQNADDLDDEVGLMLYTIRDQMKDNPKEKLKRVASIGYDYIESAGYENGTYYGMAPADFNQFMDSIDLEPMSAHHGSMTYENADKEIADAVAAGFEFVVIPVPPMGMFTYDFETRSMGMKGSPEELVTFLNTVGKKAKKAGLELLYHNHDFEFKPNEEGIILADYILENTDPLYVNFQLDLFWATYAEADIEAFIKRHSNRIKAFHVKDSEFNPTGKKGAFGGYNDWGDRAGRYRSPGDGQVDFSTIFSKLTQYSCDVWAVMEWECCIKSPEQGAREGAEFIASHIIEATQKTFDDFAGGAVDENQLKTILGL
jgi:sugar phosphate isomerase/epimerase